MTQRIRRLGSGGTRHGACMLAHTSLVLFAALYRSQSKGYALLLSLNDTAHRAAWRQWHTPHGVLARTGIQVLVSCGLITGRSAVAYAVDQPE